MNNVITSAANLPAVGIYADAANRGLYTGQQIQQVAESFGWAGPVCGPSAEFYPEATDEAYEFLGANCTAPGYSWGMTEDGSLAYWTQADWNTYYED